MKIEIKRRINANGEYCGEVFFDGKYMGKVDGAGVLLFNGKRVSPIVAETDTINVRQMLEVLPLEIKRICSHSKKFFSVRKKTTHYNRNRRYLYQKRKKVRGRRPHKWVRIDYLC